MFRIGTRGTIISHHINWRAFCVRAGRVLIVLQSTRACVLAVSKGAPLWANARAEREKKKCRRASQHFMCMHTRFIKWLYIAKLHSRRTLSRKNTVRGAVMTSYAEGKQSQSPSREKPAPRALSLLRSFYLSKTVLLFAFASRASIDYA